MKRFGYKGHIAPSFLTRLHIRSKVWWGIILIFLLGIQATVFGEDAPEILIRFTARAEARIESSKRLHTQKQELNRLLDALHPQKVATLFAPRILPPDAEEFRRIFKIVPGDRVDISRILPQISRHPEVVWAEPNHVYQLHQMSVNDSLYPRQWALPLTRVPEAWQIQQGNPNIVVGVIDTGVDYNHEDLQGQYWVNALEDLNHNGKLDEEDINGIDDDGNGYVDDVIGWDFTDAPNFPDNGDYLKPDNDPMDEYPGGHGTAVAGIIAARTNNGKGIAGVAPGSRVMILRAGTAAGFLEEDDIAEAILYAVQNGCKIVNMSFGDVVYSHLIKDAVDYGTRRGVLFVASAGNAGNFQLQFPAAYDNTISVGAVDSLSNLAGFSSYGAKVDLVAPGVNLYATRVGDEYNKVNGTSFSAPMVSGALALIWAQEPEAPSAVIRSRLLAGCRDVSYYGWDTYYGHGVLDVYASLLNTQNTIAEIHYPATLKGIREDTVSILGTAVSSNLKSYQLAYAAGELPVKFHPITEVAAQVLDGKLGEWVISDLPDSIYVLQLKINNWDGSEVVHNTVVDIDRTAPRVTDREILPMVVGNLRGYLIRIQSDDRTMAYLMYRLVGDEQFTTLTSSAYFDRQHTFLITPDRVMGQIEFYMELKNASGLTGRDDNNGQYYRLDLEQELALQESFTLLHEQPGFGYFLERSADFDSNGVKDLVAYAAWPDAPQARLNTVRYENGQIVHHTAEIPAFPRDLTDVTGDGIPELFAGYGAESYLFPGTSLPEFTASAVTSPQQDFWVGRVFWMEGYQKPHVLALHQGVWQIFLIINPFTFQVAPFQTLDNPTEGENSYGVPHALIGDPDGDGRTEIILGDYDGDVIVYRDDGNDHFSPVAWRRMPGEDATHQLAMGDFDGDGLQEIAVATRHRASYVGESSVLDQFWYLDILKIVSPDSLAVIHQDYFHGLHDEKGIFNGLTAADYDGDGQDELFFTPYPYAYYLQFRQGEWVVDWSHRGVNSVAVPPLNPGQFLLVGDSTLMVWQREEVGTRPPAPRNVRILAADTARVVLNWQPVSGAQKYLVQRQAVNSGFTLQFTAPQPPWTDSSVTAGAGYRYTVQSVDASFPDSVSVPSSAVTVYCVPPPALVSAQVHLPDQVVLEFSEPLGERSFRVNNFWLRPENQAPTSVVRGRNAAQLLLSFASALPEGQHQLAVFHLESRQGVPLFQDTLWIDLAVHFTENPPYLTRAEILSRKELLVEFDRPMEKSSVENPENYTLEPDDRVVVAHQDSSDARRVWLSLTGRNRLGALGVDYYLTVRNVRDVQGVPIQEGVGNRLLLRQIVTDVSKLFVFPNPLRPEMGQNEITFGNVPRGCEIFVYSASGKLVRRLKEEDENGGVFWDLRNELGQPVSSGVYIFVAHFQEQSKIGKFVILK